MEAPHNAGQEKAPSERGNFSADTNQHVGILPHRPAAHQLPSFRVEQRPTPITAPSAEVTVAVIFDGANKLPDDWLAQIQCAIIKAKQQAGIADTLTLEQQLYWGGR